MGIPSYSNGHVRKQVPLLLPVTQPHKVLYFINSNDLHDNFNTDGSHSIYHIDFSKDDAVQTSPKLAYSQLNRFLLLNTPYPWLGKNSHLWMLLKKSFFKDFGTIQKAKPIRKTPNRLINLAMHHVQHLTTFLKEKNIPLQIIWISHQCQLRHTDGPQCDINYDLFENNLNTLAEENKDVSFFSATPGLIQKMQSQQIADHFFPDRHFNLKGYQIFTEVVYPTVKNFITPLK